MRLFVPNWNAPWLFTIKICCSPKVCSLIFVEAHRKCTAGREVGGLMRRRTVGTNGDHVALVVIWSLTNEQWKYLWKMRVFRVMTPCRTWSPRHFWRVKWAFICRTKQSEEVLCVWCTGRPSLLMEGLLRAVAYPGILLGEGVQQIQLKTKDRENGDLGAVAP